MNIFTNIKRVDIPKINKKKSSELGLKGRDIYVNQRGVRKITLKSKLKNACDLEEIFCKKEERMLKNSVKNKELQRNDG